MSTESNPNLNPHHPENNLISSPVKLEEYLINLEKSLVETQTQEINAILDYLNALTLCTWGLTIETYLQRIINK